MPEQVDREKVRRAAWRTFGPGINGVVQECKRVFDWDRRSTTGKLLILDIAREALRTHFQEEREKVQDLPVQEQGAALVVVQEMELETEACFLRTRQGLVGKGES